MDISFFSILLLTGISPEEATRLKWSDLDFNNKSIKILRDEVIVLPISEALANQLKTYYLVQKEKKVKLLSLAALFLLPLALFYFLIFSPKNAEQVRLKTEIANKTEELKMLRFFLYLNVLY